MEQTQTIKPEKKCSECIHHRENDIPERPNLDYILLCKIKSTYVTKEFAERCKSYNPSIISMGVMSSK